MNGIFLFVNETGEILWLHDLKDFNHAVSAYDSPVFWRRLEELSTKISQKSLYNSRKT